MSFDLTVVADDSVLSQERIDEIIKIGEMAEKEGIEPGYLISGKFDYLLTVLNHLFVFIVFLYHS